MQEQLISLETAKLACEKGFTENVDFCYDSEEKNIEDPYVHNIGDLSGDDELYAPTQSLLQKWLREVHNTHIQVYTMERWLETNNNMEIYFEVNLKIGNNLNGISNVKSNMLEFNYYEEALEAGLQTALNLLP